MLDSTDPALAVVRDTDGHRQLDHWASSSSEELAAGSPRAPSTTGTVSPMAVAAAGAPLVQAAKTTAIEWRRFTGRSTHAIERFPI